MDFYFPENKEVVVHLFNTVLEKKLFPVFKEECFRNGEMVTYKNAKLMFRLARGINFRYAMINKDFHYAFLMWDSRKGLSIYYRARDRFAIVAVNVDEKGIYSLAV